MDIVRTELNTFAGGWEDAVNNVLDDALSGFGKEPPTQKPPKSPSEKAPKKNSTPPKEPNDLPPMKSQIKKINEALSPKTYLQMSPQALDDYLGALAMLARGTGRGGLYPDTNQIADHLEGIREIYRNNQQLVPARILRATGLPYYSSWSGVEVFQKTLRTMLKVQDSITVSQLEERLSEELDPKIREQILTYISLSKKRPLRLDSTQVEIVGQASKEKGTKYRITRDALSQSGVVQRTSMEFYYKKPFWSGGKKWVERNDSGALEAHPDIHNTLARLAGQPVGRLGWELFKLIGKENIVSISRGNFGPIWFKGIDRPQWATELSPEAFAEVVGELEQPNSYVAELRLQSFKNSNGTVRSPKEAKDASTKALEIAGFKGSDTHTLLCSPSLATTLEKSLAGNNNFYIRRF